MNHHPAHRPLRARLAAAGVIALALLFGVGMPATASSTAPAGSAVRVASVVVPGVGPDCHGEPPLPAAPMGHLGVRPAVTSTADPFTTAGVSIESVYGTSFRWWAYDNGCGAADGIMPALGANIGNLTGLELPGLLPSWGHGLYTAIVNPHSWIGALDAPILTASASVAAGTWFPWITLALTVVAVLTLLRARDGRLAGSITAAVWALLVLVVVSWLVAYPKESVDLVDAGVHGAVVSVADGFDPASTMIGPLVPTTTADQVSAAERVLDRQWDVLTRQTVFRSWLEGVFGSADSTTARTFGPRVFAATHFRWDEYDTYLTDPTGAGKTIVEAKAEAFRTVAEQVKDSDPIAYDYLTGNRWGERIGTAILSFAATLMVALFLTVAGIVIVFSYLLIRLLVPIAPAAGVVFVLDTTREVALAAFRRAVKPLLLGPVFFLAALVVLKYNVAILSASLPGWLKLVLVAIVGYLVWKLLRPVAFFPKLPTSRLVTTVLAARWGAHHGAHDATQDARKKRRTTTAGDDHEDDELVEGPGEGRRLAGVVHQPQPIHAPNLPIFTTTIPGDTWPDHDDHDDDGGYDDGYGVRDVIEGPAPDQRRHAPGRLALGPAGGTFTPRPLPGQPERPRLEGTDIDSTPVPPARRGGAGGGGGPVQLFLQVDPPPANATPAQPDRPALPSASAPTMTPPTAERPGPARLDPPPALEVAPSSPAVHETNLTYDEHGRRVFVVYSPPGWSR